MKLLKKVKGKWIAVAVSGMLATVMMQSAPVSAQEYSGSTSDQTVTVQESNSSANQAELEKSSTVDATQNTSAASLVNRSNSLSSEPVSVSTTSINSVAAQDDEIIVEHTDEKTATEQQTDVHTSQPDQSTPTQNGQVSGSETPSMNSDDKTNVLLNGQNQSANDTGTQKNDPATVPTASSEANVTRDSLQSTLQSAQAIDLTHKSANIATQLQMAIDEAKKLIDQADATPEQLQQAYRMLKEAIAQAADSSLQTLLQQPNFPHYKIPLVLALEEAGKVDQSNATPQSLDRLAQAVAEGMLIVKDETITDMSRIVASITEIAASISAIEQKEFAIPKNPPMHDLPAVNESLLAEVISAEKQLEQAKTELAKEILELVIANAYAVLETEEPEEEDVVEIIDLLKQTQQKLPLYDAIDSAKNEPLNGRSNIAIVAYFDALDQAIKVITAKNATEEQIQTAIRIIDQTLLKLPLYDAYAKATAEDTSTRSQAAQVALNLSITNAKAVIDDNHATIAAVKDAQVTIEQALLKLSLIDTVSNVAKIDLTDQSQAARDALSNQLNAALLVLERSDATAEMVQQAQLHLERTVVKFPLFNDLAQADALDLTNHTSYTKAILHTVKAEVLVVLTDLVASDDDIAAVQNKLDQTIKKLDLFDQIDALNQLDGTSHLVTAQKQIELVQQQAEKVARSLQASEQEIADAVRAIEQTIIKIPLYNAIDRSSEIDLSTRSGQAARAFYADLNKAIDLVARMDVTSEQVTHVNAKLQDTIAKLPLYDAKNETELARLVANNKKIAEAVALLDQSLAEAKVTLENENATENDIRRAIHTLTVATNKVPLFEIVQQTQDLLDGKLKYTQLALNYRLKLADIVLKDPNSSKALIDAEVVRMKQVIDRIPLYEVKSRIETASRNRSTYSRAMLSKAFDQVNQVLAQPTITEREMDRIIKVADDLIERVPSYDLLSDKVNEAQRKKYGQTAEAVHALDDVNNQSNRLLENEKSTSKQLIDQAKIVENTVAKLPLFSLVHQAENLNLRGKTANSIRNLQVAIRRARVVLSNKNATINATTEAMATLHHAIANLQTIPASNTGGNNGGGNAGSIVIPPTQVPNSNSSNQSNVPNSSAPTTPSTTNPAPTLATPEIRLKPSQTSPVSVVVESINQVGRIFQTEEHHTDTSSKEEQAENATTTQQVEVEVNNTQPYVSLINMVLDTTTIPALVAIAVVSLTGTVCIVLYRRIF